jgi:hypothetical protein
MECLTISEVPRNYEWFDVVWYDDIIYLLTVIWSTSGGSSAVHIYTEQHIVTEYPERNIKNNKNT